MFNLSYSSPSKIQGTIEVSEPIQRLGPVTDVHEKQWHIHGIYGYRNESGWEAMVQACPMSAMHPYYTSTANESFGMVHQSWKPYKVKIVSSK